MAYQFDGKRALVTGGSRGIGKSIAKALLKAGAEVYVIAKTQTNLDNFKAECPNVHIIAVDLADWEKTRTAVENLGDIDLLVNNAAAMENIFPLTPFVDTRKERLDIAIDVNLKAVFNVSQIVARGMIKRSNGGAIVNVSGTAGTTAVSGFSTYCISKAGMEMMTKVLALELGPHKIRVNTITPTGVNTETFGKNFEKYEDNPEFMQKIKAMIERHPLGKFAEMTDVVNATLFLLSDKASMITGTNLPVDGGYLCG